MNLTDRDMLYLKDTFRERYRTEKLPPGGIAELWVSVVMDFLEHKGLTIVPKEQV